VLLYLLERMKAECLAFDSWSRSRIGLTMRQFTVLELLFGFGLGTIIRGCLDIGTLPLPEVAAQIGIGIALISLICILVWRRRKAAQNPPAASLSEIPAQVKAEVPQAAVKAEVPQAVATATNSSPIPFPAPRLKSKQVQNEQ
jgi:hypothetical protein